MGPGAIGTLEAPAEAPIGSSAASIGGLSVEGNVLLASESLGPQLYACGQRIDGVVAYLVRPVTPGRPFALRATDANAAAQDLDIHFNRGAFSCANPSSATPQHYGSLGDEAGYVPNNAVSALVWLYEGADASFRYTEFAPVEPADTIVPTTNALGFRFVQPAAAKSTYHDMYEPHIAVAGTGAIYLSGHTMSSNTHHSPAYVSRDDGASWEILPDPAPLPDATRSIPFVGGKIGQGNEGGIAADDTGRAWLYDAAYGAGSAPLYGWCDDGRRACSFDPVAFDLPTLLTTDCPGWPAPRVLDKPWVSYGNGKLLLANVGLPLAVVDEFRAASMVGTYDPDTGARTWNTCAGVGGMPGIPSIRESDGYIAIPQIQRTSEGDGWMHVHHGPDVLSLETSAPIHRAQRSWQLCDQFNGYGGFDGEGTYFLFTNVADKRLALSATTDFASFDTIRFDIPGYLRYMWLSGNPNGPGALLTWGLAPSCDETELVDFYAAHATLGPDGPVVTDATLVARDVKGTCGHYMGNDVGPDGRAYFVVHASAGYCLGVVPTHVPGTHVPWRVYIQDEGPTL